MRCGGAPRAVIVRAVTSLRLALLRWRARGRLRAADGVRVGRGARVSVARGARVELGAGAVLGPGSRIEAVHGTVRLGPGARLGERAVVVSLSGVDIGAGAVVGDWAAVIDAGPTWRDAEVPTRRQPLRALPVVVGREARVGLHAAVLAGVTLGDGAVVAPYAVVERDIPGVAANGGDRGAGVPGVRANGRH
jgi:acetyltransferase-like isoleucine patch superfamily enzyme